MRDNRGAAGRGERGLRGSESSWLLGAWKVSAGGGLQPGPRTHRTWRGHSQRTSCLRPLLRGQFPRKALFSVCLLSFRTSLCLSFSAGAPRALLGYDKTLFQRRRVPEASQTFRQGQCLRALLPLGTSRLSLGQISLRRIIATVCPAGREGPWLRSVPCAKQWPLTHRFASQKGIC